jgi:hypothetical protein
MFYRKYIEEALINTWALDYKAVKSSGSPPEESSAISLLVFNIFGGEILKTHNKNGWHFYNRIDSECIDFAKSAKSEFSDFVYYENLSSTPAEAYNYFTDEDYSSFFIRFVRSYEEVVSNSGQVKSILAATIPKKSPIRQSTTPRVKTIPCMTL